MATLDSKKVSWFLGFFVAFAVTSTLYVVHTFFRLDRIKRDTVERYWNIYP